MIKITDIIYVHIHLLSPDDTKGFRVNKSSLVSLVEQIIMCHDMNNVRYSYSQVVLCLFHDGIESLGCA